MKRRLAWTASALALLGLALWFEPTGVIRGWLRGEAFYRGRPTSYWSREIPQWKAYTKEVAQRAPDGAFVISKHYYWQTSQPSWNQWLPAFLPHKRGTPSLLRGDPASRGVLQELLNDSSPEARKVAQAGLEKITASQDAWDQIKGIDEGTD